MASAILGYCVVSHHSAFLAVGDFFRILSGLRGGVYQCMKLTSAHFCATVQSTNQERVPHIPHDGFLALLRSIPVWVRIVHRTIEGETVWTGRHLGVGLLEWLGFLKGAGLSDSSASNLVDWSVHLDKHMLTQVIVGTTTTITTHTSSLHLFSSPFLPTPPPHHTTSIWRYRTVEWRNGAWTKCLCDSWIVLLLSTTAGDQTAERSW